MRHDLNSAVNEIAKHLKTAIGIRRTTGGSDDSNRMKISWQLIRGTKVIGMIDLICEDGLGKDGLQWQGKIRITAPNVDYEEILMPVWYGLHGRIAKRITRQKFYNGVDRIIDKISKRSDSIIYNNQYQAVSTYIYS